MSLPSPPLPPTCLLTSLYSSLHSMRIKNDQVGSLLNSIFNSSPLALYALNMHCAIPLSSQQGRLRILGQTYVIGQFYATCNLVIGVGPNCSYCDHYIIQSSHNQLKMSLSKIPLKLYSSSLYYNVEKKLLLEQLANKKVSPGQSPVTFSHPIN